MHPAAAGQAHPRFLGLGLRALGVRIWDLGSCGNFRTLSFGVLDSLRVCCEKIFSGVKGLRTPVPRP